MKKQLLVIFGILISFGVKAQEGYHDSTALAIMDKVGEYFGELNSLKFTTQTAEDVAFSDNFFIKEFKTGEFVLQGPNKLAGKIHKHGKDHFYFYNGSQIVYYSLDGNFYAAADAPDKTLDMLEWLYTDFGVELVVADFLYPNFSQNMIDSMDYLEYLGQAELDGNKAFHIGGTNSEMTFQLWVSQDLEIKPMKAVITYFGEPYSRQLEVSFGDWEVNQTYPNSIFEFLPPPSSKQIIWTKKN
ncbi:DUF2092 domain-containing protein [Algoriphagus taiwanensis]|uniref:DUF2092 domain-containing protein n=1 Tax=Algoriphagus taiwanensis TaxID=1445656 RepID=A0ABQ6Q5D8_9BACT|nr:hypothetical protein Ataiwa_24940 [Algoriphagus taiwanensis]